MANVKTLTVNNVTYNIVDASAVHQNGNESIAGQKTVKNGRLGFENNSLSTYRGFLYKVDSNNALAIGMNDEANANWQNYIQFNTDGSITIRAKNGSPVYIDNNIVQVSTISATSDNSKAAVNTEFLNKKFKYVTQRQANPDANTFYFVKES
jgi:hypothetical protein